MLGAGNVALDVARVLAKTGDEMLTTDIPAHVYDGLKAKRATDVHVFARRGPAYAKFSPLELRELAHSPNVDVIVHPEGFEVDDASMEHIGRNKQAKMVLDTLANWVGREPTGKPHRIHLHFLEQPVEIVGDGAVETLRTERTRLVGDGTVEGTGLVTNWDVQAVYRAVGYRSSSVVGLPFDDRAAVVPNDGGRVLDLDGERIPGTYVTGWIKRGPIGLIGHTKSDAAETVAHLVAETTDDRDLARPGGGRRLPRRARRRRGRPRPLAAPRPARDRPRRAGRPGPGQGRRPGRDARRGALTVRPRPAPEPGRSGLGAARRARADGKPRVRGEGRRGLRARPSASLRARPIVRQASPGQQPAR